MAEITNTYTDTDTLLKFRQQTCMNKQRTIQRNALRNCHVCKEIGVEEHDGDVRF